MHDPDFALQMNGQALTTAQIFYFFPDYPSLVQHYSWQLYDEVPDFPRLFDFLDFWRREIEAAIQSVRIAYDQQIGPAQWRHVDRELRLG